MTSDTEEDAPLIRAIVDRGDEHAFRVLYARHTPRLHGFLRRMLGERADEAEDLVQETWIRAGRALPRFRGESSFGSWLTGIGVNVARNELRRDRKPAGDWLREEEERSALAERIDLETAIARLPERYRTVLVLHDIYGHTHEQIGELLGIPPGTSKSQLSRARSAVRASIGEKYMEAANGYA